MQELLLIIGALLPVVSSGTYIWAIIFGTVRPQVTTRFLLMLICGLSFASLVAAHDHSGVWLALTSAIQSVVLWLLSLWRGIGSVLNKLDLICVALCLAGAALWLINGQALLGLIASIVADFIGCVPSLVKTVRLPHTEALAFYLLDTIAGACILFGGPPNGRAALYPVYIMVVNVLFVVPIARQRLRSRRLHT
jgi:hypothetical protein